MIAPRQPTPRRRLIAGALVTVLIVTIVAIQTDILDPEPEVLDDQAAGSSKKGPIVDAACDVDGVTVAYDASYSAAPGPAGYRVVTATVGDVAETCVGAEVSVALLDGTTELATGTADATSIAVAVTFSAPPPARDVTNVSVTIAGGTVPVPAECDSMTFDNFRSLTADPDVVVATKGSDLVYGLAGSDDIRGDNKEDCLVGQAGDDVLWGDNHADVLIGGDGNDTLEGGNHDDLLVGGPGNDVLRGGNGRDECRGGGGNDTYVSCEVRS